MDRDGVVSKYNFGLQTQPTIPMMPKVQEPKKQDDIILFEEANKELERLKGEFEQGKISYEDLKIRFETIQNQPFYQRILKLYDKR